MDNQLEIFDPTLLEPLINKKVSYAELCTKLNIKRKTSNAKKAQLKEIAKFCDIQPLYDSKYIIKEVYDEDTAKLIGFLNCPRQQLLFNIALYKKIKENGPGILFCSNTQLLKLLGEVNENFSYTFSQNNMNAIGDDYIYMHVMTKTVYNILMRWTRRKIRNMGYAIISAPAFRLYKEIKLDNGDRIIKCHDVAFSQPLYNRCQRVMDRAISEVIPDEKYLVYDEKTHQRTGFAWMPEGLWMALENKINYFTKEEFKEEGFSRLNTVTAFSAASGDTIDRKLEMANKELKKIARTGGYDEINKSAIKKIINTIQLNDFTKVEREKYIEYNMKENPPELFKEILKAQREKENRK